MRKSNKPLIHIPANSVKRSKECQPLLPKGAASRPGTSKRAKAFGGLLLTSAIVARTVQKRPVAKMVQMKRR